MMLVLTTALLALQPPGFVTKSTASLTATTTSRRAVLLAAPMAVSAPLAASAFNPLDILFGWIPPVGGVIEAPPDKDKPQEPPQLSRAELIQRRRKELMEAEEQAQLLEYQKNRGNSAASRATDAGGLR